MWTRDHHRVYVGLLETKLEAHMNRTSTVDMLSHYSFSSLELRCSFAESELHDGMACHNWSGRTFHIALTPTEQVWNECEC